MRRHNDKFSSIPLVGVWSLDEGDLNLMEVLFCDLSFDKCWYFKQSGVILFNDVWFHRCNIVSITLRRQRLEYIIRMCPWKLLQHTKNLLACLLWEPVDIYCDLVKFDLCSAWSDCTHKERFWKRHYWYKIRDQKSMVSLAEELTYLASCCGNLIVKPWTCYVRLCLPEELLLFPDDFLFVDIFVLCARNPC